MDSKTVIATAISVVVTMTVTLAVGWVVGVFEKGVESGDRELIIRVINEELKTPDGLTHAAALQTIDRNIASINTKVGGMERSMTEIRAAMLELAKE